MRLNKSTKKVVKPILSIAAIAFSTAAMIKALQILFMVAIVVQ